MGIAASTTGIDTIPVKKDELLQRLEENKKKHEREFVEAHRGYQKEWLKQAQKAKRDAEVAHTKAMRRLDKAIAAAEKVISEETGDKKMTQFPLHITGVRGGFDAPPRCFTKDYELALDLFKMFQPMDTTRPGVIDLSRSDFAHYCRDDWSWKPEHIASVANYSGPAGPAGPAALASPAFQFFSIKLDEDEDED